jgi:Transposase DDE domain/Transposase domain (DUF772)
MFKENNSHLQQSFLTSKLWMNKAILKRLIKSWASVFYNVIFCRIDEKIFSILYCQDNGRTNFPVNILLSLEYIKHLFDYSDAELIEQFYYNYQIAFALGINNVGEINLAPSTLYEFRKKIYQYAKDHPEDGDLIFKQFIELTKVFAKESDVSVDEQRMDSTMISANIKNAGRLALAFDVLEQTLKTLPKELLTETQKEFLGEGYRNKILYKCKGTQIISKLQEILDICIAILDMVSNIPEVLELNEIKILKRFIDEQTDLNKETGIRIIKGNKSIKADSLQSAYDEDATYRKKAKKVGKGYVVNIAETCNENNDVQYITDYDVAPNIASDVEFAEDRIPIIKANFEMKDTYVDGAYFSKDVEEVANKNDVTMHYTDMTGKKLDDESIPVNKFELNDDKTVKACPVGEIPQSTSYNCDKDTIVAHFTKETCNNCEHKNKCCIEEQVRMNKFSTTVEAIETQNKRDEIRESIKENSSKRTAIEGTNSELKRAHGLDDVKVRGIIKVTITTGMKITACNFKRFAKNAIENLGKKSVLPNLSNLQGIILQI